MGCGRALVCIIFPPLAVIDRGCGTILIVFVVDVGRLDSGCYRGVVLELHRRYAAARSGRGD